MVNENMFLFSATIAAQSLKKRISCDDIVAGQLVFNLCNFTKNKSTPLKPKHKNL